MDANSSGRISIAIPEPGQDKQSSNLPNQNKGLQIVDPTSFKPNAVHTPSSSSSSSLSTVFKLPDDWVVEERPRRCSKAHPGHVDKYYYEPGTGRKFRSLLSVRKHLSGETNVVSTPSAVKCTSENNMQIVPYIFRNGSSFNLPDGWVMEYYIEPRTRKWFRSWLSLGRYLAEGKEYVATPKHLKPRDHFTTNKLGAENHSLKIVVKHPVDGQRNNAALRALKPGKHFMPPKSSGSVKKQNSGKEVDISMLDFSSPPAKIKWVLNGPRGNIWSPYVDGTQVSISVKQKWSEEFVSTINDAFSCP